jgi:hypothetical protein
MPARARGGLRFVAAVLAGLGGAASCPPADTRPPAGSILLTVTSADEPSVTTADGWSISLSRFLLGMGHASLGDDCTSYSEARYERLLDGRLPSDQKLSILFGLGRCDFQFGVVPPSPDTLLGEGVSEADKELMGTRVDAPPGRPAGGIAVDLAGTATRGTETKRFHFMLSQATAYFGCVRTVDDARADPIQLTSDENLTLHIGVRGAALFSDDGDPSTAVLRFDPFAAADTTFGDDDDDVTLDELAKVTIKVARDFGGPYGVGTHTGVYPSTFGDYLYLVALSQLVGFRENIDCLSHIGFAPD